MSPPGERRPLVVDAAGWGAGPRDPSIWIERRGASLNLLLGLAVAIVGLPLVAVEAWIDGRFLQSAGAALAWPCAVAAFRHVRRWRRRNATPP